MCLLSADIKAGGDIVKEFFIKFELITGSIVEINFPVETQRELYDLLNADKQWIGTGNEKVNMNHVTHYVVEHRRKTSMERHF